MLNSKFLDSHATSFNVAVHYISSAILKFGGEPDFRAEGMTAVDAPMGKKEGTLLQENAKASPRTDGSEAKIHPP